MTKTKFKEILSNPAVILSLILCIVIPTVAVFVSKNSKKDSPKTEETKPETVVEEEKIEVNPQFLKYTKELPSRAWMEYAMDIVREEKPTPPESSRFYAYVSITYATALDQKMSDRGAGEAVTSIINQIYPSKSKTTDELLEYIHPYSIEKYGSGVKRDGKRYVVSNTDQANAINTILQREKSDGFYELKWDEIIPKGDGKWTKTALAPFAPKAGEWRRWIVTTDFKVPEPPKVGSAQDKQEIEKVKKATLSRSAEQSALINFWGGVPGTEAPAGIWQNRMYDEIIKKDGKKLTDEEYAKYQSLLAQSLADSFMECWKVKYNYWTARPSMRIENLNIAMNNPNFPSYVSGHSTISSTASEVLGVLFPQKKDLWIKDAQNARDSRLWGGIHFDVDNQEGFKLGENIGKEIINRINLEKLTVEPKKEKNLLNQSKLQAEVSKESHLNAGETKGDLLLVNPKDDKDQRFVLSNASADTKKVKLEDGWESELVGTDAIWMPGACSSMPTVLTGNRYIAMFDYGGTNGISVNEDGTFGSQTLRFLSYDTLNKEFKYILKQESINYVGNDVIYSETLMNEENNSISYFYTPKDILTPKKNAQGAFDRYFKSADASYIVRRVLNMETLEYKDYRINIPGWKTSDSLNDLSITKSGGKVKIGIGRDSQYYYTIEDNEVNLASKIDLNNVYDPYIDSYKVEEIEIERNNGKDRTYRILDRSNKEYYRATLVNTLSLEVRAATKDKIMLAHAYGAAQTISYSELGYFDIKNNKYISGVKEVINERKLYGDTYYEPELTFFIVGIL